MKKYWREISAILFLIAGVAGHEAILVFIGVGLTTLALMNFFRLSRDDSKPQK